MTAVALRAILMMPLAVPIREAYSGEDVGDLFKAGPCPERNDIAPGKSDTTRDDSGAWNDMVADMERPAPGRDGGAEEAASRTCPFVGGQAVMEGILMRNGGRYAVAVRRRDGSIVAERRGWLGMTRRGPLSRGTDRRMRKGGERSLSGAASFYPAGRVRPGGTHVRGCAPSAFSRDAEA